MTYEHDLVERAARVLVSDEPTIESLLRRRDRKRRNERIAAGAVGLAVGIAVVLLGSAYLRSEGERRTGDWPTPSITSSRIVRPAEVLLDPYASGDNPTYVIAADVTTGAQRIVAGCKAGCRLISSFDASADGGWIAYHLVMCEAGECQPADPEGGLWVVGAGAPSRLVLVTPRVLVGGFEAPWSWSPTGAQLAYADVDELILLDPTTWEHTPIATAAGTIHSIAWGPDGRSIAYSVEPPSAGIDGPGSFGVFVVRSSGEPDRVSDGLGTVGIEWSPDGGSLLLDRIESDRSAIELVAADGSDDRVLVEDPSFEGPGVPVWSPDGRRIAFVRTPGEPGNYILEFWVMRPDGSDQVRVARLACCPDPWDGPVWSPDSRLVAWSSFFGRNWEAADAGGGSPLTIDRLEVERWRQG